MEYLSVEQANLYLGLKKSFLYSLVEAGAIPHYKIGRLIRFKKDDIDRWMEDHRVESVSPDRKAKQILKTVNSPHLNIDKLIKKTIAQVKENEYTPHQGKPDRIKGLRKEVGNGTF